SGVHPQILDAARLKTILIEPQRTRSSQRQGSTRPSVTSASSVVSSRSQATQQSSSCVGESLLRCRGWLPSRTSSPVRWSYNPDVDSFVPSGVMSRSGSRHHCHPNLVSNQRAEISQDGHVDERKH